MSRFKANLGISYILFSVLHLCLFVLSLAVIGLYATDIQRATEDDKSVDSKLVSYRQQRWNCICCAGCPVLTRL